VSDSSRVFAALADSNRRSILQHLVIGRTITATALAVELDISRQAVAKHLGLLSEAGLAHATRDGRETLYRSDLAPLTEVNSWIATVESQWSTRLEALSDHLS
jgi:DNA-binding transcriptional ArsR family regulator